MDDEYLRTVMSLKETAGDHPDARSAAKASIRALRKPRKQRFARAILDTVRMVRLRTPADLDLGLGLTYNVDFDRLGRVVARIVRALYWNHFGDRIPDEYTIGTLFEDSLSHLSQKERDNLQQNIMAPLMSTPEHILPRGVLRYWYKMATGDEPISGWLCVFYDNVRCLSLVVPESTRP